VTIRLNGGVSTNITNWVVKPPVMGICELNTRGESLGANSRSSAPLFLRNGELLGHSPIRNPSFFVTIPTVSKKYI
jgi:hypothetical protein